MKQFKFLAVALAALTMLSCSKEQGNDPEIGKGEAISGPTYATFKFNIGGAGSRAAADYNPTTTPGNTAQDTKDAQINKLQLLIFNATSLALEHNEVITAGTKTKTVLLTAGKKKIFFVANSDKLTDYSTAISPATFKSGAEGATLTEFYKMHFSAGTPQQITANQTAVRTFNFKNLYDQSSATSGLPMTNTNEIIYSLTAGISEEEASKGTVTAEGTSPTNTFKVQLYYMTAKARLVLANNVLSPGSEATPVISNVKYAIRNLARASNYVQNVATGVAQSFYYYVNTFTNQEAYNKEFDYASNIVEAATTTAGNYLYVPENNHQLLTRGQSSYFAIKANFEPIVITKVDYDVSTKVKYTRLKLAAADATNKAYIYTTKDVQGVPAGTYFQTVALFEEAAWMMQNGIPFVEATHRAAAKLLVADPASVKPTVGGDYMSFTNAQSYYRIDLGEGTGAETSYGVLRSNKYDATINKITGPGVPSEEDLTVDPTEPVSARTYISATIVPATWNPITQSADL